MNFYTAYVSFIILLKVIFVFLAVAHLYNKQRVKRIVLKTKKSFFGKIELNLCLSY